MRYLNVTYRNVRYDNPPKYCLDLGTNLIISKVRGQRLQRQEAENYIKN